MDEAIETPLAQAAPSIKQQPDDALTQVDPNYVKILRIVTVIVCLPFIVASGIADFALPGPPFVIVAVVAVIALVIILRVPFRRYHARGYDMREDRLRVVRGVLFRSDTVVPFGRVQHIDVDQGPLERHYGLATLTLHTAGNHNASVALPGLRHEDAKTMRETIRAKIRRETI